VASEQLGAVGIMGAGRVDGREAHQRLGEGQLLVEELVNCLDGATLRIGEHRREETTLGCFSASPARRASRVWRRNRALGAG
jgi:hypothetical protein